MYPVTAISVSACVIISFFSTAVTFSAEESPTPRQLAEKALEAERNDAHREHVRLTWPDAPPACPKGAEIFLIDGNIDYRCRRLTWDGTAVRGDSIEIRRTWFYNPSGEAFITDSIALDPERFQTAWKAAALLAAVTAKEIVDADGGLFHSASAGTSSHERTKWIRLSAPGGVDYLHASHGRLSHNDIENFDSLRNRALFALLDSFFPEPKKPLTKRNTEKPEEPAVAEARKAAVARWAQLMASELPRVQLPANGKPDKAQRALLEPAFRILGEAGYAAATESIQALSTQLKAAGDDYFAKSLLEEAFFAQIKIEFLTKWNTDKAVQMIRSNPRAKNTQNDLSKWLRKRLAAHDPPAYYAAMLEDIADRPNDEGLLCEDISELSLLYREASVDALHGLMRNQNIEIAASAALAVLLARPDDADSLNVLERIASDPSGRIPPNAKYFNSFGRERALDAFIGYGESGKRRWTTERIRKQISLPNEDGRLIKKMLGYLGDEKDKGTLSLSVWRQVLAGPRNWGAVTASEELMQRKDMDSVPQIEKLFSELEAGCSQKGPAKLDPDAKFPWINKYELESLRTTLKKMSAKE